MFSRFLCRQRPADLEAYYNSSVALSAICTFGVLSFPHRFGPFAGDGNYIG